MTIITREDAAAVNDLFDRVDRDQLDLEARTADYCGRVTNRSIEMRVSVDDLGHRNPCDVVAETKALVRAAYEQGFDIDHQVVVGSTLIIYMRRGLFELVVGAPAWLADHEPLLTFEPHNLEEVSA